jgi:hypothetical protein
MSLGVFYGLAGLELETVLNWVHCIAIALKIVIYLPVKENNYWTCEFDSLG